MQNAVMITSSIFPAVMPDGGEQVAIDNAYAG